MYLLYIVWGCPNKKMRTLQEFQFFVICFFCNCFLIFFFFEKWGEYGKINVLNIVVIYCKIYLLIIQMYLDTNANR